MEYIYASLLLHKAGKKVDEATLKHVLEAAGITPDNAKIKALIAALDNVNIEEAIKKAAIAPVAAPAAASEKKEEKKAEEEKKSEEQAAAGLGALFG